MKSLKSFKVLISRYDTNVCGKLIKSKGIVDIADIAEFPVFPKLLVNSVGEIYPCFINYFPNLDTFSSFSNNTRTLVVFCKHFAKLRTGKEIYLPLGIVSNNTYEDGISLASEVFNFMEEFAFLHNGYYPVSNFEYLKSAQINCGSLEEPYWIPGLVCEITFYDEISAHNPNDYYNTSADVDSVREKIKKEDIPEYPSNIIRYFVEVGGSKKRYPFRYTCLHDLKENKSVNAKIALDYVDSLEPTGLALLIPDKEGIYDACGYIQDEVMEKNGTMPYSLFCANLLEIINSLGYIPKMSAKMVGIQTEAGASINMIAEILVDKSQKLKDSDALLDTFKRVLISGRNKRVIIIK